MPKGKGFGLELYSKPVMVCSIHHLKVVGLSQTLYQRRHPSSYCFDYCENSRLCKKATEDNAILIKDILATRPHIPNKKESKIMRKAKIKKGV